MRKKNKICRNDKKCNNVSCKFKHPERHRLMLEKHNKKKKILLVFDLNGTLTSTSKVRHEKGSAVRPGIKKISELFNSNLFHIAIWSSAMKHNVNKIKRLLENETEIKFDLVLTRENTIKSPTPENKWATQKPLCMNFKDYNIKNIILIDDSSAKSYPSEKKNLLLVPTWNEKIPDNDVLEKLVELLMTLENIKKIKDVRKYISVFQEKLWNDTRK